ncbi:MAG: CHASE3 domain-containing protein [Betaproteobacteria bacterium]|nr:CHASE3 domain-containing protein [Betaproteobacteria bacterium]
MPRVVWLVIGLVVVPALALFALETYVVVGNAPESRKNRELVVHTFEFITAAQSLQRAIQDTERGQRGFLIADDPAYLVPYQKGVEDIPALLEKLRQLAAGNAEHLLRIQSLERQIEIKLAELRRSLDVRQTQGIQAARQVVRSNVGLDAMEAIGALIDGTVAGQTLSAHRSIGQGSRGRAACHDAGTDRRRAGVHRHGAGYRPGWVSLRRIASAERAQFEQQRTLERIRAELAQAQKMEALGQLSGGIAHDFTNVLQVINNAIAILNRRPRMDAEVVKFLDMIKRNADRAASLTQRLLEFSRTQPLNPKVIDPNALVAGMVDLLRQTLGDGVGIDTSPGAGVWPIEVDTNQLETALVNLAVNARDAMPAGGVLGIETTNAVLDEAYADAHPGVKAGDYALISVSDTGTGMTPEVLAKAFDPFFTTKAAGQGTGLGLAGIWFRPAIGGSCAHRYRTRQRNRFPPLSAQACRDRTRVSLR